MVCIFLCLAHCTSHNTFMLHPFCCKWLEIFLCGRVLCVHAYFRIVSIIPKCHNKHRSGCILRSEIARSYSIYIFSFEGTLYTSLHHDHINLYSHQQCREYSFLYSITNICHLGGCFMVISILTVVRWYAMVGLTYILLIANDIDHFHIFYFKIIVFLMYFSVASLSFN